MNSIEKVNLENRDHISRILIVGLGSIGARHLRLARMFFPHADIRVLRHKPVDLTSDLADGIFWKIEDALTFKPNIVIIANPATMHLQVAIPFAKMGAHLLIEKPISHTDEGVKLLLEICHKFSSTLLVGYNLRFSSSLINFRNLLHENEIGRCLSVRCEVGHYLPLWRPDVDYRSGVSANKCLGGGALLELSHELDYLSWIFGKFDWVKASVTKQSNLEIDVEDSAHLIYGFEKDRLGNQLIGTLSMDFIRHDAIRQCTVIGEAGSLKWNGIANTVEKFSSSHNKWIEIYCGNAGRDDSYIAQWQHFVECIHGSNPIISGNDGLEVLKLIKATRLAANSGETIQLRDI